MVGGDVDVATEALYCGSGDGRLTLPNVMLAEEELPVEVADVDGVKVDLRKGRAGALRGRKPKGVVEDKSDIFAALSQMYSPPRCCEIPT